MYYFFGKISDQTLLERSSRSGDINLVNYTSNVAINKNVPVADISVLTVEESSADGVRLANGDDFALVWVGNALNGLDFTPYDAMNKIRFNSDKAEIIANGIESCKVTVKLLSAIEGDLVIDVPDVYIPVLSPIGIVKKKVSIVGGIIRFDFSTMVAGEWVFPAIGVRSIAGYKVKNPTSVNALLP